jgi:hypothetical protein
MNMTPEAEAAYAIDNRIPRSQLSMGAQLVYDRVLEQQVNAGKLSSVYAVPPFSSQLPSKTSKTRILPSHAKNKKKRLRSILAVMGVAIVVAVGGAIYAIKTSTAKTSTANVCVTWESSSDGQVFDEDESDGFCNSTILRLPPQDGGVFNIDSGEPTYGSQVCSVSAHKSTDIIYKGSTGDSAEAEKLCAVMKSAVRQGAS